MSRCAFRSARGMWCSPRGNALKYLRRRCEAGMAEASPCADNPGDVRALSFCEDGDERNGNTCETDLLDAMEDYDGEALS